MGAGIAALRDGQVDAWSVRFPAAAGGLGCVLLLFGLGHGCGRGRAGTIAAVMLATGLHYTWLARTGRIDMPLTFVIAAALAGFYLGPQCRRQQRVGAAWSLFLLSYFAAAAALLLTGPIRIILPAGGAARYLLLDGQLPHPPLLRPRL